MPGALWSHAAVSSVYFAVRCVWLLGEDWSANMAVESADQVRFCGIDPSSTGNFFPLAHLVPHLSLLLDLSVLTSASPGCLIFMSTRPRSGSRIKHAGRERNPGC